MSCVYADEIDIVGRNLMANKELFQKLQEGAMSDKLSIPIRPNTSLRRYRLVHHMIFNKQFNAV